MSRATARGLDDMQNAMQTALSGLLSDAPLAVAEAALRSAYRAFFERPRQTGDGTSTMRQAWYREARKQLAPWKRREQARKPRGVRYTLTPDWKRSWWLGVSCDWCREFHIETAGCLMCAPKLEALAAFVSGDDWQRIWRPGLRDGSVPPGVFADWLDEKGLDELARLFRAAGEVRTEGAKR